MVEEGIRIHRSRGRGAAMQSAGPKFTSTGNLTVGPSLEQGLCRCNKVTLDAGGPYGMSS